MLNDVARRYARYAVALLALTLLAGVYLRALFTFAGLRPPAALGLTGPNLVHAHSHAGFFGWAVLGAFAVLTARPRFSATALLLHRVLASAIGIGSLAAFVGFAQRGYDTVTIALSAAHVLLWVGFAAAVWSPLGSLQAHVRSWYRAAVVFLVVAGLATVAPVLVMVRGVSDPWLQQLSVKLFLTPFVTGFLVLTALGVLAERLGSRRHATTALAMITVGTLPSTLLYVAAPPPSAVLILLGRLGIGAVGAGLLLFVGTAHARFARGANDTPAPSALAWVVLASAAVAGALKVLAMFGVGAAFMHSRNLTVAVLHLVLLGIVTPAFVLALRPRLHAPVRTVAFAAGLLLMVSALGVTAWPAAVLRLMAAGVQLGTLYLVAFAGSAAAAVALLVLFVSRSAARSRSASAAFRSRRHAASGPPR